MSQTKHKHTEKPTFELSQARVGIQDGLLESIGGGALRLLECRERGEFFYFPPRVPSPRLMPPPSPSPLSSLSTSFSSTNSQRTVCEFELRLSRADQLLGPREQEEADAHGRSGKEIE